MTEVAAVSLAKDWATTAERGFFEAARYLRSIPEAEWTGPTGCARWSIRDLAGHIVGEAVWFPNLVRGLTRGETPLPMDVYQDLKGLAPHELADRTETAARDLKRAVEEASPEQLRESVDMGFAKLPLWRATAISMMEAVLHNWDARAKREPNPTIPSEWALATADPATDFATTYAHRKHISDAPGTYLLEVSEGVGPITVTVRNGELTVDRGGTENPDVSIRFTPDRYVRFLSGRLDLRSSEGDAISIEGERERALRLTKVFGGIANGD